MRACIPLFVVLGLGLNACNGDAAALVGQLAKDPATSCMDLQVTTPWGSTKVTYARSNSTSNSAASDANGGCALEHNRVSTPPAPSAAPTVGAPVPPVAPVPLSPVRQNVAPVIWKPDLVNSMSHS